MWHQFIKEVLFFLAQSLIWHEVWLQFIRLQMSLNVFFLVRIMYYVWQKVDFKAAEEYYKVSRIMQTILPAYSMSLCNEINISVCFTSYIRVEDKLYFLHTQKNCALIFCKQLSIKCNISSMEVTYQNKKHTKKV